VVRGGGACEVALAEELLAYAATVPGRPRLGVEVLAHALLVIPKTLARNAGFDATDAVLELRQHPGMGLDLHTGKAVDVRVDGILDLYRVKRQILHSATVLAQQLLLVDEVLRATGPAPQRQQ
jgi:T-complex protein 1 subunit zeta